MLITGSGPCVWLKGHHPLNVWAGNLLDPAQAKHSRPPLVPCLGTWKAKFLLVVGMVVMPGNVYSSTGEQLDERCFTVEAWSGYYTNKNVTSFLLNLEGLEEGKLNVSSSYGVPGHCYSSVVPGTLLVPVWVAKHKSQRQLLNQRCCPHLQHGEPCGTWEGALCTAIERMAVALMQKVNCKLSGELWHPGSQSCHLLVAPCALAVPSFKERQVGNALMLKKVWVWSLYKLP